MNFLAPLFLAGLALVAGPILFHLIRQIPRKRVLFSSSELLEASEPRTEKSRRIQNPWLLLIRCLIIALLAFAFARPFIPSRQSEVPPNEVRRDVVIALDQSSSMRRTGIKERAIAEVQKIASTLGSADQLSVFSFADTITPLVAAEQWSALEPERRLAFVENQLEKWNPNHRPGYLDRAIEEAVAQIETLREQASAANFGEIFLVSDFARGTSVNGVDAIEWPADLNIARIRVAPTDNTPNLGMSWLGWSKDESGNAVASVAVSSTQPESPISATLSVRDAVTRVQLSSPLELVLENNSASIVTIPLDPSRRDQTLLFSLEGDGQTFDNSLHVAPPHIPKLEIGLLSSSAAADPTDSPYFIAKGVQGFESPLTSLRDEATLELGTQAFIVNRSLSRSEADSLRGQLENGKTALVLVSSIEYAETVRSLTSDPEWGFGARESGPLLIGSVDLIHPLFSPFADARFSNFASIRFWKSISLSVPENPRYRVIAQFDDGSPLLTEVELGEGRLFVWASSWAPQASQWILSSKFIPFLHRFAELSAGGPSLDSNVVLTEQNTAKYEGLLGKTHSFETGLYPVLGSSDRWVAFQASPLESDTRELSSDEWDSLGLPEFTESQRTAQVLRISETADKEAFAQTERRQGLWKWLLWAVLALLAIESYLAISVAKQRETVAP